MRLGEISHYLVSRPSMISIDMKSDYCEIILEFSSLFVELELQGRPFSDFISIDIFRLCFHPIVPNFVRKNGSRIPSFRNENYYENGVWQKGLALWRCSFPGRVQRQRPDRPKALRVEYVICQYSVFLGYSFSAQFWSFSWSCLRGWNVIIRKTLGNVIYSHWSNVIL